MAAVARMAPMAPMAAVARTARTARTARMAPMARVARAAAAVVCTAAPLFLAALALAAIAACSGGDDEVKILPSGISSAGEGGKDIVTTVKGEEAVPAQTVRTVVVKEARPFLEPSFLPLFLRKQPKAVSTAFNILRGMFAFPDRNGKEPEIRFSQPEVKLLREQFIAAVARATARGRRQFVEDLETFAVFDAAFKEMDGAARKALFDHWKKLIGDREPSRPLSSIYPLFWLRESIQLWSMGGRNWWWASCALHKDPAFTSSYKRGAVYTAPDGTIYKSRK